jgi:hypothetical protein
MSISQNFPAISPTLNLNFARSKKLDPRITFTRTSSATRTNAQGLIEVVSANTPRFEHSYNSSTGSVNSLGLLIEESRSNLTTYSEQFSDASWTKARSSVSANSVTSPDGTTTADTLTEDTTASDTHSVYRSFSATSGTTYTLSVFFKSKERTNIVLAFDSGAGFNHLAAFSSSSGTVGTTFGSPSATSITAYPNGWYRCSMSAAATSTATANALILLSTDNTIGGRIYTGDGTSGIYLWGAQLEAGAFPTSYIPTVASTVTRSADNASMTGTNFTSWYNSSEGSVYCRYNRIGIQSASTTVPTPWGVSDGTFSNSMTLIGGYSVPSNRRFDILNSGSATAQLDFTGTETAQTFKKVCVTYKLNDIAGSYNAETVLTDTSSNIPSVNQLCIGRRDPATLTDYLNGNISQLLYYPRRLTNTQLQNLTK